MKKKILQTIRQHQMVKKGMHIVIGLSGGPDSMCMFDVLCSLAEDWQLKLYPVHVNHKFRPGAAEEDQAFVETFCRKAGWPCRSFVRDCSVLAETEGLTPEEAGRKVRYEAFSRVAEELLRGTLEGITGPVAAEMIAIAVGQNADDQAETVLFRLLRGTGVDGLSGIAYKRWNEQGLAVIRPLLDVSRSEIEAYCGERNLMPRRDHTNEEPVYMRNRIRLQLLPYLREGYNPNISAGLTRLAASAAADSDFIWQETETAYGQAAVGENDEMVEFSLEILDSLHQAIRIRLYHKALTVLGGGEDLSAAHLEGIEQVRKSASPSASWSLPGNLAAEKRYDRLCLRKLPQTLMQDQGCQGQNGRLRITVRTSPIDDATVCVPGSAAADVYTQANSQDGAAVQSTAAFGGHIPTACFDLGKLQEVYGEDAAGRILLRNRQDGDYIRIRIGGGLHRKKLQDVLVDMKVPKSLRDEVKLAAIGSEVLWMIPAEGVRNRYSAAYNIEDNCETPIIILEYLCRV